MLTKAWKEGLDSGTLCQLTMHNRIAQCWSTLPYMCCFKSCMDKNMQSSCKALCKASAAIEMSAILHMFGVTVRC